MPREVMKFTTPTLKVATDEAGLATGLAVECQVTSAVVTAQPVTQTVPATGCAPEADSPGASKWQLELAWLQDWAAGEDGLSWFAFEHDTEQIWFELIPVAGDTTTSIKGTGYAVAGGFGATFGDGSAATATATWPLLAKPTVVVPTTP